MKALANWWGEHSQEITLYIIILSVIITIILAGLSITLIFRIIEMGGVP